MTVAVRSGGRLQCPSRVTRAHAGHQSVVDGPDRGPVQVLLAGSSPAAGVMMPGGGSYGTKIGRLTYRTPEEARAVADELGLSGIHSHMHKGERVWMPGGDHESLNQALRSMGLASTAVPGDKSGGGMASDPEPMAERMDMAADMDIGMSGGVEPVEEPEPMFDMDELTGDRDGDDDMEVY